MLSLELTAAFAVTQFVRASSQSWMILKHGNSVSFRRYKEWHVKNGLCEKETLRLARLVTVVCLTGLAGSNGGVVDKLEKMLSEPSNNGELLTMLTEGIELIGESSLELLTGDIRELGLGDQRLSLGADKFLLENHNLRAVWFLVFELGDFVGDFLFPCETEGLDSKPFANV